MKKDSIDESLNPNYSMPAEWSPHTATLLAWPHNKETWPGSRIKSVEKIYRSIIITLLNYEPVLLIVNNETIKHRALKCLGDTDLFKYSLQVVTTAVNDVWVRDCGPIFVQNMDKYIITDWEFNSWGGKYSSWLEDNKLPEKISDLYSIPILKTEMVLEGGSVETNGDGLFLTTQSVLLNPNRNPGFSRDEIESNLNYYLGAKKIIWLKKGLIGDDTDGHIDDLTRFVNRNTVVTTITEDTANPNYELLQENLHILQNSTGINGEKLHIIPIPLPNTIVEDPTVDGSEHVPSSYANFYIANGVVLLPLYDKETDQQMLNLFAALFPGRVIEGIPCSDLVWGQGSIHCITQQMYV